MDASVLDLLAGEWSVEAVIPLLGPEPIRGGAHFERSLDGAVLVERSWMEHPDAPDALAVMTAEDDGTFLQHYFDARGVVRLYRMTLDGTRWTLQRDEADFSPLPFHQRFTGALAGDAIDARWEQSPDGEAWELDFALRFRRTAG
jgi:hypothetical protein